MHTCDQLSMPPPTHTSATTAAKWRERLWRERCFALAVLHQMRWRMLIFLVAFLGSTLLLMLRDRTPRGTFIEGAYEAWFLVMGNPVAPLPNERLLRIVYFILPLLGVVLILQTLIDTALLVRDRRLCERSWCKIMAQALHDHIIIVGLGKLGFRTFTLLRRLGKSVVVLEVDPNNRFLEDVRRDGSALLVGDARRDALLVEANVASASAIILATDNDMANLEIALDARRMNPKVRVVMRMFDQTLADKIGKQIGIESTMSQSSLSAPAFATAAISGGVVSSMLLDDHLIVTRRLAASDVPEKQRETVGSVMESLRVSVIEVRDGRGATMFPPPATPLTAESMLLVQGTYEDVARIGRK